MEDVPRIQVEQLEAVEGMDKYTAGIELSNACRSFYVNRLRATQLFKQKLENTVPPHCHSSTYNHVTDIDCQDKGQVPKEHTGSCSTVKLTGYKGQHSAKGDTSGLVDNPTHCSMCRKRRKTSIDTKMEFLKGELVSLIDQDLTLMQQLLTLNEQIEDLKWHRKMCSYSNRGSLTESSITSSYILDGSLCTLSESECEPETLKETEQFPAKYPSPSSLSLYGETCQSRDSLTTGSLDTLDIDQIVDTSTSDLGSSEELANSVKDFSKSINSEDSSTPKRTVDRQLSDYPEVFETEIVWERRKNSPFWEERPNSESLTKTGTKESMDSGFHETSYGQFRHDNCSSGEQ